MRTSEFRSAVGIYKTIIVMTYLSIYRLNNYTSAQTCNIYICINIPIDKVSQPTDVYISDVSFAAVGKEGPWWRHQMEKFSALLALCAGNSPVPGEFPAQRPVTRSFDVFFDVRLNKRLSKQSWGWWFETQSGSLWRHRNEEWVLVLNYTWCNPLVS